MRMRASVPSECAMTSQVEKGGVCCHKVAMPAGRAIIRLLRIAKWRIEAGFFLAIARFFVRFLPFRSWRWTLGEIGRSPSAGPSATESDRQRAIVVGKWVRSTARRVPFEAVCLPQAMAGRWMLKHRGLDGRIVFGAGVKEGSRDMLYHAWLRFGDDTLTGQDVDTELKELSGSAR